MAHGENTISGGESGDRGDAPPISVNIVEKRGRGRPRKDGAPTGSGKGVVLPMQKPSIQKSNTGKPPAVDVVEGAKFLGDAAVSCLGCVEAFVGESCAKKVAKSFPEKLKEFEEMLATAALKDGEKKLIASSVEKIAMRHEAITKFAPEILLLVVLGQYGLRQTALIRFVNSVSPKEVKENGGRNENEKKAS